MTVRTHALRRSLPALALACLLLGACEWEEGYGRINDPGPHPLVGPWGNVSVEVYLDAEDGIASSPRAIALDETEWAESGLQPPEIRFTEDGYYITVQRSLEGRELQRTEGYWVIDEGELMLFQREPTMERQQYTVTMRGTLLNRMEGLVDWQSKGRLTDRYVAVYRRLREEDATIPIPPPGQGN